MFCGVGQFGETVGEFKAFDVELEAFGIEGILGRFFGESGLGGRVVFEDLGLFLAEVAFEVVEEEFEEDVVEFSAAAEVVVLGGFFLEIFEVEI